jgi:CubicO group peptidase (beta-lactamase class C family)
VTAHLLGRPPRVLLPRRAVTTAARRVLTGSALVVLVTGQLLAGAPAAQASTADDAAGRIASAIRTRMDASGVPSAAFVVVDGSGAVARGLGDATAGHPATARTPFVLGSTSKSFTALAVMQLVDAGRVDLDTPVRHYVPELQLAAGEAVEAITVRQILQQTSGIPSTAGGQILASAREGTALDAVRELRGTRLAAAPGRLWQYSNANYVLAGLVVQRASGMPFAQYVQTKIFDPLGMTRSFTAVGPARAAGLADGHRYWFGLVRASGPVALPGLLAAGYLISTAEDMGRYLRMYLDDGLTPSGIRVVSAKGLRTMLTPGPTAQLGPWAGGMESRYAMGWFVGGPWQAAVTFHPGNSPDSTAMIALMPQRGMAVATLVGASHELPLPGNPAVTDRITRAAVEAALAEPTTAGGSLRTFYLVFDLAALTLLGAGGYGLVRAGQKLRDPRRPRRRARELLWVVVNLVLGMAVLSLPLVLGFGWAGAWTWIPDFALVLLVLGVLLVAGSATRLLALIRPGMPLPALGGGPTPERAIPTPGHPEGAAELLRQDSPAAPQPKERRR